ncbi:MAG: hypothetical protein RIR11_74 [Bacteroidota bacterium]|jgi:hypothetical protein
MNKEDDIELLKKVGKLDAPPFLYTRIVAKIEHATTTEQLPLYWKWIGGLVFSILFFSNIYFTILGVKTSTSAQESLVSTLNIHQSNQFYDE